MKNPFNNTKLHAMQIVQIRELIDEIQKARAKQVTPGATSHHACTQFRDKNGKFATLKDIPVYTRTPKNKKTTDLKKYAQKVEIKIIEIKFV